MKRVLILTFFISLMTGQLFAQEQTTTIKGFLVPACIYDGDTIPDLRMPTLYVFKPIVFKNKKKQKEYWKRNMEDHVEVTLERDPWQEKYSEQVSTGRKYTAMQPDT